MFSRLFGKRDRSVNLPSKDGPNIRGPEQANRADPLRSADLLHGAERETLRPNRDDPSQPVEPKLAASTTDWPMPTAALFVSDKESHNSSAAPVENQIDFVLPTAPMPLSVELSLEQRKKAALDTVDRHHLRIANTIRTLWGYRECSVYINRLIMAGGDGMGQARVGFNQDAVEAMLALSDVHDAEFGPPSTLGGALGLSV